MTSRRVPLPRSIVVGALAWASACVPPEMPPRLTPLLVPTSQPKPAIEAAPWETLSEPTRVVVPAGAWLFHSANQHAPSLRVSTAPEENETLVVYRALARSGDWLEVETLPHPSAACFDTAFAGLQLKLFVRRTDVVQVLQKGERCPQKVAPKPLPEPDGTFEVQGAYATLTAKKEALGPSGDCSFCPDCVVQLRGCGIAQRRIAPPLFWPEGTAAGVATSDFQVFGVRRDRDVPSRTCFRVRGSEERPLPRREGGTAELCVDSELLIYWDKTVGTPRPTRLPRFLVRESLPVPEVRECFGRPERFDSWAGVSWVVNDGTVSELEFDDTRAGDAGPCLHRALERVAWPRGFSWSRIGLAVPLRAVNPYRR